MNLLEQGVPYIITNIKSVIVKYLHYNLSRYKQ
ncbi:hypothetical protein SAMN05443543_1033 [Flavobacterium flevense]|nr:hypothetical protein SAMN05443543_1033 [Flavobacterium flevense]